MAVISKTSDGKLIAEKAKKKLRDRLYYIYKDAHVSSSNFSVLCHGFPVQENIMFSYHSGGHLRGNPKDAKLINFHVRNFLRLLIDVVILKVLKILLSNVYLVKTNFFDAVI